MKFQIRTDDDELEALLRSAWADTPRHKIPANWREIEPPKQSRFEVEVHGAIEAPKIKRQVRKPLEIRRKANEEWMRRRRQA